MSTPPGADFQKTKRSLDNTREDIPPPPSYTASYAETKRLIRIDEAIRYRDRSGGIPLHPDTPPSRLPNLLGRSAAPTPRPFSKSENILNEGLFKKGFRALGVNKYSEAEDYYLRVLARMGYNDNIIEASHTFDHTPGPHQADAERYPSYSSRKLDAFSVAHITIARMKLALSWIHICQGRFEDADLDLREAQKAKSDDDKDFEYYFWYLKAEWSRRKAGNLMGGESTMASCMKVLDQSINRVTDCPVPYIAAAQMLSTIMKARGYVEDAETCISHIPSYWPTEKPDAYLTAGHRIF